MPSTVELTFIGLLLLHTKDNASHCDIGIPRQVPAHHEPLLKIVKTTSAGSTTPVTLGRSHFESAHYRLRVVNCPQSDVIRLLEFGGFSRPNDQGDPQDFGWVMDFERELYQKDIGHMERAWLSWVGVGGGTFTTGKKSDDELLTYLASSSTMLQRRGRVAVSVDAHIDLDRSDSEVVLEKRRKGARDWEDVFKCKPEGQGARYDILLSQSPPSGAGPHPGEKPHADFYYDAVGSKLSPGEKLLFKSCGGEGASHPHDGPDIHRPELFVDPRAICFIGQMSLTPSSENLLADASAEEATTAGETTGGYSPGDSPRGESGGARG